MEEEKPQMVAELESQGYDVTICPGSFPKWHVLLSDLHLNRTHTLHFKDREALDIWLNRGEVKLTKVVTKNLTPSEELPEFGRIVELD